jgi:tetratricopeptide (TPR) repeat protein
MNKVFSLIVFMMLYGMALSQNQKNQYQYELELLNKDIQAQSDNAALYFQRASFYLDYRNFALAQQDISQAILLDSINMEYPLLKARIFQLEGNSTLALNQYLKLYNRDTANLVYIAPIARLYESNRQLEKALLFFGKWSKSDSLNLYTKGKIAEILLIQGETIEAVEILKEILMKDSLNLNALNWLSLVYFKSQMPDSALLLVERALRLDADNIRFLERAASIHYSRNHYYRALPYYRKVIELQDTTADIALNMGMALYGTKKYAEAIPFLNFAANYNQDNYLPFRYLGECYYYLDDTANMVILMEKAYGLLFPDEMIQISVEHSLAKVYNKAGKFKESEKYYTILLKKNANSQYYFEMARLQDEGFKDPKKALHWYSRYIKAVGEWESDMLTFAKSREAKLKEDLHFAGELY